MLDSILTATDDELQRIAEQMTDMPAGEFAAYFSEAAKCPNPESRKNLARLLLYQIDGYHPYWRMMHEVNSPEAFNAAAAMVSKVLRDDYMEDYYLDYALTVTDALRMRFESGYMYAEEALQYYNGCRNCMYEPMIVLRERIGTRYAYIGAERTTSAGSTA